MASAAEKYASFQEKVTRTVFLDNLSPQVSESVLRSAIEQFATVKSVKFIPNYLGPRNLPQCALVELDSSKKVKEVITMIGQYPFMICGMPRPVRARLAEAEMFDDRPQNPERRIRIRWLDPNHPDFEMAKELKHLTRQHAAEHAYAQKLQLLLEENLAEQQGETLEMHYKKYKLLDSVVSDGTAKRLKEWYNLRGADE
ncbi:hypothetical protein HN51_004003 [Arachis hypogaea]|uniref:RRM domain-containing protein n=1 Tax=Arachis hypogaea TaxID=3818 RepID=A0A445DJ99_ARAHY|nr:uncharacterized protein LOC112796098 [Arachis hypogaea]QHO37562.1 uncharacterized protein DS421_4g112550 [Arachis hypogaea]RYR63186.1 hypothetical protein Ahy_A04g020982 [Arachis hypogaea]